MSGVTSTVAAGATASPSVVVVTITSSQDSTEQTTAPVVVTAYSTVQYTPSAARSTTTSRASTASATALSTAGSGGSALGTGGTIGVAVAVPVVVLAALAALFLWFWKRRKRNRSALAQRKEEQDQYAFHPNEPNFATDGVASQYGIANGAAIASVPANTYRGWQSTNAARQTTAASNIAFSNGRSGAQVNTAASAYGHDQAETSTLEAPTLPAIGHMDDLDSVMDSPVRNNRDALSPGNGSPPLNALTAGSPSSEYSQRAQFPRQSSYDAPYPPSSYSPFTAERESGSNRALPYSREYYDN